MLFATYLYIMRKEYLKCHTKTHLVVHGLGCVLPLFIRVSCGLFSSLCIAQPGPLLPPPFPASTATLGQAYPQSIFILLYYHINLQMRHIPLFYTISVILDHMHTNSYLKIRLSALNWQSGYHKGLHSICLSDFVSTYFSSAITISRCLRSF